MKSHFAFAFLVALALFAGCRSMPEADPHSTKVLMIGNSFSVSVMGDLPKIADSMALDLDITSLFIGGCSFKRHMYNVRREWDDEFKPYSKKRNVRGKEKAEEKVNLPEVLKGEIKFDIITIQQASHESWDPATYSSGDELVKVIRELQPQAKICVQETWSYTPFDKRLEKWGFDQNAMYDKLQAAYREFAGRHQLEIIPMGRAVQLWRERLPVRYTDHSFGGDVVGGRYQKPRDQFKRDLENRWMLNCDAFHLNEKGEYLQALVWAAKLFREDVTNCEYAPEGLDPREVRLMKEIANELR